MYDIFAATEEEFARIFPADQNIAFSDEVSARNTSAAFVAILNQIWQRPIAKRDVVGIHGILFYGLQHKKQFYPSRRDKDAVNPDGSRLRQAIERS